MTVNLVSGINIHTWRGRRLALFRLCDEMEWIIKALDIEEGPDSLDMPRGGKIDEAHKGELLNQLSVLKRTMLLWNDGRVEPQTLKPY